MSEASVATTSIPYQESARPNRGSSIRNALRWRDFRLLWIGQGTSLLGDQFYLIALPWLVLQLTGDPLALGAILALAGIPRALFILLGGAVTDRVSPRTVMLVSDVLRLVLATLLMLIVLAGWTQVWMLYALSLAFGLVSGFFMPASGAILPLIVDKENLAGANAVVQGTAQLSGFAGPILAGGLIALFSHGIGNTAALAGQQTIGTLGIALAFGVDAVTFLVSIITLWMMRSRRVQSDDRSGSNVWRSILEGVRYAWSKPLYRVLVLLISAINFFFSGPFLVGIPVLAQTRLPEGAVAFGIIISAYGAGNLLGCIAAGAVKVKRMGWVVIAVVGLFGVGMVSFSVLASTALAFLVVFIMGVGNGYISISLITWLQKNTPLDMMGRMTSLILFTNVGLMPISQALAGGIIKLSIAALFAGAGVLIVLTALVTAQSREMKTLEL
jgi:MFS family permease